ncbi:hypothetical protein BGW80DRAFT_1319373, partial [Lactifluus volemus]
MRFSVFTLLIVLPAAAYAAVCPQQFSIQSICGKYGDWCNNEFPCCSGLECERVGYENVCAIANVYFESARRVRGLSRTGCD